MEFSQSLVIEKQESLATEKFSKNGSFSKDLHIVAKAIAFTVHIASSINLHESPLNAKLVYDCDSLEGEGKEVDMVKGVPLEFTAHVDDDGYRAAVEAKISVLSSQHEGAFFRIKFAQDDLSTNTTAEILTQPIKVISKRNQVRKMIERKQAARDRTPDIVPDTISFPAKRSSNDLVMETLTRIEEQQRMFISHLMAREQLATLQAQQTLAPETDFEETFRRFLSSYNKLPVEERPSKIRRILKEEASNSASFAEVVLNSGINAPSTSPTADGECRCSNCPHKRELEKMETFYHDFLVDPVSPEL